MYAPSLRGPAPAPPLEAAGPLRFRVMQPGCARLAGGCATGLVPAGDVGTYFTLGLMRDLVRADAPLLVPLARSIVGDGDPLAGLRALRAWMAVRVRFRRDPEAVELLQSPLYQLDAIKTRGAVAGDCDDIAIIGAALGLAAGYPARFVVVRFNSAGPFEHVYAELKGPGGWFELDTSRELQGIPRDFQPAAAATFDVGEPGHVRGRLLARILRL